MTFLAGASGARSILFRAVPLLGFGLALLALALLALAPLGWRAGWWHYRTSFTTLMPYAGYAGVAAAAVSALALVFGRGRGGRSATALAAIGLAVGAAVAGPPWYYNSLRGKLPPIHDISTDTNNPPDFAAVLPARAAEGAAPVAYEGAKVAELQMKAYPDIAPLALRVPPDEAFQRALEVAKRQGWTIAAVDATTRRFEASDRSRWFGFTDDVVVRISPAETGSRVDVRSLSRQGRSDFGVNAARVRSYLDRLRQAAS